MVILVEPREYLGDTEASRNTGLSNGVQAFGGGERDPSGYGGGILQIRISEFPELTDMGGDRNLLAEPRRRSLRNCTMRLKNTDPVTVTQPTIHLFRFYHIIL